MNNDRAFVFTQTILNDFSICHEMAAKKHIFKFRGMSNEDATKGIRAHEIMPYLITGENLTYDNLEAMFGESYGARIRQFAQKMGDSLCAYEIEFEQTIEHPEHPCKGKIDMHYKELKEDKIRHIYDWKFSYQVESEQSIRYGWQPQLYSLLLMQEKQDCDKIVWHQAYPILDAEVEVEFLWGDLIHFEREVLLPRIEEISNMRTYKPTPSVKCEWCPYSHHHNKDIQCSLGDKNAAVFINDAEDARNMFNELMRLDAQMKRIKEVLKEYTANNGQIVVDDVKYGHQEIEAKDFDSALVIAKANELKIPLHQILKVDRQEATRLFARAQKIKELDACAVTMKKTRMGKKKIRK